MDMVKFAREAAKAAKATRHSPMRVLLETADRVGQAQPDSPSHWQTVFKAQRMGFIDADLILTDTGRAWLTKDRARLA